ncbi:MAG TPA: amidohydrolase family protein, partial [Iamia sp.]
VEQRDPGLLQEIGVQVLEIEAESSGRGEEGLGNWPGAARRAVRWVKLFTRSRIDLASELVRTFGDEVDLFIPMLVDLGTGLGDEAVTSVADQVVVYELLSRASMLGVLPRSGRARVHPFVGFDPLRELRSRQVPPIRSPLEIVQEAVLRFGFVGIKLYPQMGWRPSGNRASARLSASEAAELDAIVDELAAWCEAEHVPVTSHCSNSNYADRRTYGVLGEEFGRPEDWWPVLTAHPGLHLNLGHFGGARRDEPRDGWPWRIARGMADHPNLYADVGNHRIDDDELFDAYITMLGAMRNEPATACVTERLMYGSDWFMDALHPEHEQFLTTYRGRIAEAFEAVDPFMGGSALRFLGFHDPDNRNNQRLTERYTTYAPDRHPTWLTRAEDS